MRIGAGWRKTWDSLLEKDEGGGIGRKVQSSSRGALRVRGCSHYSWSHDDPALSQVGFE